MREAGRTDPSLRVLHILRAIHPGGGGVQTYLASVASALTRSGSVLSVGALAAGHPPPFDCHVLHMGSPGSSRLSNLLAFWRWLRRDVRHHDVVHIHHVFGWHLVLAALACRLVGVPYFVSPHGRLVPPAFASLRLRHRIYLRLVTLPILRGAEGVITTTELESSSLADVAPDLQRFVVPPGLSLPQVLPRQDDGSRDLRLVFVGRLAPVKNLPVLFRAIAELSRRGSQVHADLVGESVGGHLEELKAFAAELGISTLVAFHGPLRGPAKDEVVRRAHLAVMPSKWENFSFATAEALALGVPVVVSETVGLAAAITRHGCGMVVQAGDVGAWAAALETLAEPPMRAAMARAARRCAETEFSLGAMRDALLGAYGSQGPPTSGSR